VITADVLLFLGGTGTFDQLCGILVYLRLLLNLLDLFVLFLLLHHAELVILLVLPGFDVVQEVLESLCLDLLY
jgi:hypothetical protein